MIISCDFSDTYHNLESVYVKIISGKLCKLFLPDINKYQNTYTCNSIDTDIAACTFKETSSDKNDDYSYNQHHNDSTLTGS